MASKDKGGGKGSKTAASKTLKEKRAAKKAKGNSGSSSNWSSRLQVAPARILLRGRVPGSPSVLPPGVPPRYTGAP